MFVELRSLIEQVTDDELTSLRFEIRRLEQKKADLQKDPKHSKSEVEQIDAQIALLKKRLAG